MNATLDVDAISKTVCSAIDDLSATELSFAEAVKIVNGIVSIKAQRLKILDGDKAKSRFASKLGKRRLEKFYLLLKEAEAKK